MNLLEAVYWKEVKEKEILGVEKHSAYKLMQSPRAVVNTRWVNEIKVDGTFKSHRVVEGCSKVPDIDNGGTFPSL